MFSFSWEILLFDAILIHWIYLQIENNSRIAQNNPTIDEYHLCLNPISESFDWKTVGLQNNELVRIDVFTGCWETLNENVVSFFVVSKKSAWFHVQSIKTSEQGIFPLLVFGRMNLLHLISGTFDSFVVSYGTFKTFDDLETDDEEYFIVFLVPFISKPRVISERSMNSWDW